MHTSTEMSELKELWTRLLPEIPADDQWELWLMLHHTTIIRHAITQLAVKYKRLNRAMDSAYMVKFASSVMNRLTREPKAA